MYVGIIDISYFIKCIMVFETCPLKTLKNLCHVGEINNDIYLRNALYLIMLYYR